MSANTAENWIADNRTFQSMDGFNICYRDRGQGPAILLLHGFPTWSYDYADVASLLEARFRVLTFDFLGYGASSKPRDYAYSVSASADIVEALLQHLQVDSINLVIHDYGGIVGQELLDRSNRQALQFSLESLCILNCGIVYSAYRPTRLQKLLALPVIGRFISSRITKERTLAGLNSVRGHAKLNPNEFEPLWYGMSLNQGHTLAHRHILYNKERATHSPRWERALTSYTGPLKLIWGMDDPVSGSHVLEQAVDLLPHAEVHRLPGVGHFPASEAPDQVAQSITEFIPGI